MKKRFGFYAIAWATLLALFNVIAFVSVGLIGDKKYTPSFWIGYILITLIFIGHLICAYFAFKGDSAKKLFYNISLIKTSYTALIASFIIGGLCMLIAPLPYFVGIIACAIVLAVSIISVVKAVVAIDEVTNIDNKIKESTKFIKALTTDAETLTSYAKNEEIKTECKKVYEKLRYSDPMSNEELNGIETEIKFKFDELSSAVKANDGEAVNKAANELMLLITDRNNKCKLLK